MAKTREYMDYLDNEIGIAPANSQEEFQAAETIVELMKDHDLEPTIQEFDAHPLGRLMPYILAVVMFVGMLLAGLGSTALRLLGFLLAVIPAILLLLAHSGRSFFNEVGPSSKSQNVIAVHHATGDKVTKGNRPIVIVAHYDTPHESVLYGRLAQYQVPLRRASLPCVIVVLVAALTQVLTVLPSGLRIVFWIIGLIATLPLLLLAFATFVEHFSACTTGANDNKSSVAALLSVMDRVRPVDDRVSGTSGPEGDDEPVVSDQPATSETTRPAIYGVRHGKEALEALGILPETCVVVYEDVESDVNPSYDDAIVQGDAYVEEDVTAGDYDEGAYEQDVFQGPELGYEDMSAEPQVTDATVDEWQDDSSSQYGSESVEDGSGQLEQESDFQDPDGATSEDLSYEEGWQYEESNDVQGNEDDWGAWSDGGTGVGAATHAKQGLGTRMKRAFQSLRERMTNHKGGSDIDIPRGASEGDGDFSEFEETDWGEEDWSDGQYVSQDEPRAINREEMIARRSATRPAQTESAPEPISADEAYEEDGYDDGSYEEPSYEEYDYEEYEDEEPAADFEEEPIYDGEAGNSDKGNEESESASNRTVHDISHEEGPDWSVVDPSEVEEQPAGFDPTIYDQNDDQLEDLYDLNAEELAEVEDELDDDQLASERPQRRETQSQTAGGPSEETNEAQAEEVDAGSSGDPEEDDLQDIPLESEDNGQQEEDDVWGEGLAWDEEDDEDDGVDDVLPKDTRGLDTMSDDYGVYEDDGVSQDQLDEPEPIDDPTWGQTTYEPPKPKSNVARRAMLYDVPSPSDDAVDPLATGEDGDEPEDDGSEGNRARNWKGGAAIRSDLLDDGSEEQEDWQEGGEDAYQPEPSDQDDAVEGDDGFDYQHAAEDDAYDNEELQDAILGMGDDLLISHDIWFVAVGASAVDHAGMRAFLANFRQDIRGAFLINLDCVGAGVPTILTYEGFHAGRRSDRRLVRLLSNVADDLHISLQKASYGWGDTDATPAMRARVRAVTIMGMDENGLPALSHTTSDIPENVNPRQVSGIVRTITEAIRRS